MSDEFILKFKGEISGKEDIDRFFDDANRNAERYGANLKRALTAAGGYVSAFAGKAKSELSAFAGKELGASFGTQARGVLQLRDAINQLAVSSGGGNEMMADLNKQIQAVSMSSNQLQGDVTGALQAFVERTGDLKTARENLALYGKVATATSASLQDVALVGVELKTKLDLSDQAKAFGIITAQAKAGAIEMKDFATKAPRMFAAIAAAGGKGELGLREAGAMAQVYAGAFGGKGTPASVATAIENTFATMSKKRAQLEAKGIKFVDEKGQDRDRFETLFDIIRATKGSDTKLRELFTTQGMRGVNMLAKEFRETGKFNTFEKFSKIQVDAAQMDRDFATRTSTGEAKIKQQEITRARFMERYFGGIAEFGAAHATELQIGATGLGFAGKGLGLLGGLVGRMGGRAGAAGTALSSATAQHVFVVNWPTGLGAGLPGGGGGAPMGRLGQAASVLGVGVAAYELTTLADEATGGHVSGGVAKALGFLSGQKGKLAAISKAGEELNQLQLQRKAGHRADLTRDFEMKGMTHGLALQAADKQIKAEVQNLTVVINGEEAHVETDTGTRSPKVMVRRGAGAGGT